MGPFNHFRPLTWAALMAGLMTAMADATATANPGIFEVDLLFPRNATYTPQPLMPIVWAIQNPPLASPLEAMIEWQLWEGNNQTSPGSLSDGDLELYLLNISSSDPYLVWRVVNTIAYPDGVWTLAWGLEISNCSQPGRSTQETITLSDSIIFATNSSRQAPDLVAATSADMCGTAEAFAFDVTSVDSEFCGALGPSPTTNPCRATIDPAAASSISAAATAAACLPGQPHNPNVTCPTPTFASSADAAGRSRMAAASTLLMLLATLTALIHLG